MIWIFQIYQICSNDEFIGFESPWTMILFISKSAMRNLRTLWFFLWSKIRQWTDDPSPGCHVASQKPLQQLMCNCAPWRIKGAGESEVMMAVSPKTISLSYLYIQTYRLQNWFSCTYIYVCVCYFMYTCDYMYVCMCIYIFAIDVQYYMYQYGIP